MKRSVRQAALPVAVLLISSSCQTQNAPTGKAAELTLEKVTTFGGPGDAVHLVTPTFLHVTSNGTTLVADPKQYGFLEYDSTGHYLRTIGRQGQGPGEIQMLEASGLSGDTLWVYDFRQSRITYFPGDGAPRTQEVAPFGEAFLTLPLARLSDGSFLMEEVFSGLTSNGAKPSPEALEAPGKSYVISRVGMDGRRLDSLDGRMCQRILFLLDGKDLKVTDEPPLRDCPFLAADEQGKIVYIIGDIVPGTGGTPRFFVTRLGADHKPAWTKWYPYEPKPVTAPFLDSTSARLATRSEDDSVSRKTVDPARQAKYRKLISTIKTFPTITAAVTGPDGTLALRRETQPAGAIWLLLDSTGTQKGTVTLPNRSKVLRATATHLWVAETSAGEEIQISRYAIRSRHP